MTRKQTQAIMAAVSVVVVLVIVATIIVTNSNSSTTTIRTVAAPTPTATTTTVAATTTTKKPHHKPKVVTRTTTTVIQAAPQTVTALGAGSQAGAGERNCDQNIVASNDTSCQFAAAVFAQYAQDEQQGGPFSYDVYAHSDASGQDYTDSCIVDGSVVYCSHGNGESIHFPLAAAEVYGGN